MPKDKNIVADIIDIGDDSTSKQRRIRIGKDNDLNLYHYQANSYILNNTGNLVIENKNEDGIGKVQIKLGTTSDTDFEIVQSDGTPIFNVDGSGAVSIPGNLTTGTHVDNSRIEDLIIELGHGRTGDPSGDCGIVLERGNENNAFMGFDDSEDKFIMGTGTFTGATSGNLVVTPGTLQVAGITSTGVLTMDTSGTAAINIGTEAAAKTITIGNDASTKVDINALAIELDSAAALTLDGASGVNIQGNASEIDVTTTGALDLNSGAFTLNCSTSTITSTDTTSLSMEANSANAKTLTIDASNSGAGTASINIGTTSATAINIGHTSSETTVNDNLNVTGTLTANTLQSDASNNLVLQTGTASRGVITIAEVANAIQMDTDSFIITSSNGSNPLVLIKNTTDDANPPRLTMLKERANPANDDECGAFAFSARDDANNETRFAEIKGIATIVTDGSERGQLSLSVAEYDGNLTSGLTLSGTTTDGQVDATLGAGTASTTTIAGTLEVTGTVTANSGIESKNGASGSGFIDLYEDSDNGTNKIRIIAPSAVTSDITLTLPDGDGDADQVLTTNGSGTLSWATASGGGASSLNDLSDVLIESNSNPAWSSLYIGNDPSGSTSDAKYNIAVGTTALDAITTGERNVAIGYNALTEVTSGGGNIGIGSEVGELLNTGSNNILMGSQAGHVVTGSFNIGIGYRAMFNLDNTFDNIAIGSHALLTNVNAVYNIAIGSDALKLHTQANSSEGSNIAIGYHAGDKITSGKQNVILGKEAGSSGTNDLTTGNNNIIIGYNAAASAATVDNEITLGNADITTLRCADTTIASLSDRRDKNNIVDSNYGLDFINTLKPRQFTWQTREKVTSKDGKTRIGFIAQELQEAMPNNENEILDLVYESNPDKLEAKYGNLVPILVKAVQELTNKVNSLEKQLKNKS